MFLIADRFNPLAGITWVKTSKSKIHDYRSASFQSPCGDYMGEDGNYVLPQEVIGKFQSPCGDYMGEDKWDFSVSGGASFVSIPLRGLHG